MDHEHNEKKDHIIMDLSETGFELGSSGPQVETPLCHATSWYNSQTITEGVWGGTDHEPFFVMSQGMQKSKCLSQVHNK